MGLTVNTIKTEVVCQWSADIPSTPPTFTAAGEQLSVVPSFRYLGSILSEDNTIDNEVQNRIKQASAAFGRLRRRVFQNKNLHLRTKVCVYQAICITTLLYSCEAWVTYSRHIRALEQFHIRCLQRILGITWRDRVPHSEVLSKTNCRSIEATITQHQLRWLGHVVRMPSNRLPRRVLYGQLHHGRRSAGGQKKRYKDQLKTALKKCRVEESLPEAPWSSLGSIVLSIELVLDRVLQVGFLHVTVGTPYVSSSCSDSMPPKPVKPTPGPSQASNLTANAGNAVDENLLKAIRNIVQSVIHEENNALREEIR
ncbi:hypothetical protein NHX12_004632 [Muraenolepis orangiensis]|uniref:Alkylated DNA repair protein AlkB homologue 8 N-terminal domain-containing protein n=1 Tax=Muraenolepis orangiensis TaxID=630683 RepID=A0A9Q0DVV6_9TELE|nr:hypothetical protein NHX12_004632 [Muraenolepis orangiensis]